MTEPYALPTDAPVAIQVSGGRSSGYLFLKICEHYGGVLPDNAVALFQNTGREMPETLDFILRLEAESGQEIVWLEAVITETKLGWKQVNYHSADRTGKVFEALIDRKKMLPSPKRRFCTEKLKTDPSRKYMKSRFGEKFDVVLGIRYDENGRVERSESKKNLPGIRHNIFPLHTAKVTNEDILNFWRASAFDLQLPVDARGRTLFGNCDGCMMKSQLHLVALLREHPERFAWWNNLEIEHRARRPAAGWNTSGTRAEIKDHYENQGRLLDETIQDLIYCDATLGGCHD